MDAKKAGKALLFGAAVGATTYAVRKLWPVVKGGLGLLKAAWDDVMDELDTVCLHDDTDEGSAALLHDAKPEAEQTVAEMLGGFLGIPAEKARKLLDDVADDTEADDTCEDCKYLDPEDEHCRCCDGCEIRSRCGAAGFCHDACRKLNALPMIGAEPDEPMRDMFGDEDARAYFAWRSRVEARQRKASNSGSVSAGLPYNVMSNRALKDLVQNIVKGGRNSYAQRDEMAE